jgi:C-terminal processing protease CtpA/Prc
VERWLERAASIEASGSAVLLRRRAMRGLRYVAWLRGELAANGVKVPARNANVELGLTSLDGKSRRTIALPLAAEKPIYGQRIRGVSRTLDGNVGYLRIASMEDDDKFLDALDASMAAFRDTRGLVIDVRGNGGGSRAALVRLFPYFMTTDDEPHVANVAAARLAPAEKANAPEGFLADRWLFPPTSSRYDARDRAAIDLVAARFVPEWKPAAGAFSAWHYLVLRRASNPKAFHYDKPVIVLLDADCFSATDVFLAAFAGRPGITLVGQTSGGGSGRAIPFRLPNSKLILRLSSMVSFRADGRSIDGRGVEPDVKIEPDAGDFIGRGDAMLDAALTQLR